MIKLTPFVLLGIFLSGSSLSQSIIKVHGDADAVAIKAQVKRSLDYLDIHETVHIDVSVTASIPKRLKGLTLAVPPLNCADNKIHIFRIRIDERLGEVQRLNILAHEMMHVRQYLNGDLQVTHDHKVIWKGRNYSFRELHHRKTPWELQAYRHDQYLAKVLKDMPNEMPPLMASEIEK